MHQVEPEQAKLGKEPHSAAEKENLLPDCIDESSTVDLGARNKFFCTLYTITHQVFHKAFILII